MAMKLAAAACVFIPLAFRGARERKRTRARGRVAESASRPDLTAPQREVYYVPSMPKCCLRWLAPYYWDYRYC
eukprot:8833141-Pyramimonas_sp.AAC.1